MSAAVYRATIARAPRADGRPYETDLCGIEFDLAFERRDEDPGAFLRYIERLCASRPEQHGR